MRRLVLSLLAVALAAGCTESGAIKGKIVVGKGHEGLAVMALIGTYQLERKNELDPNSDMIERRVLISQMPVGTSTADGGEFTYTFHSLAADKYFVGAYLDLGDDRAIDEDPYALVDDLVLDPSDPKKQVLAQDVFLETSAPDKGTLRGVVHLSQRAAQVPVMMFVLDKPITEDATTIASARVQAGTDAPFEVFNVRPGPAYLLAIADINRDGNFDPNDELVAMPKDNPFTVDLGTHREVEGVEIWLDRQSPSLGRIKGAVTLNAAVPRVRVQLYVFTSDPDAAANANIVSILNLDASSTTSTPFDIQSLPLGTLYLGGIIRTTETNGRVLSTWRVLRHDDLTPRKLLVSEDAPLVDDVQFRMGVGRVSGSISITNAPERLSDILVQVQVPNPNSVYPKIWAYDVLSFQPLQKGSNAKLDYVIFGLEDGEYGMQVTPDMNPDPKHPDEVNFNDDIVDWSFPKAPQQVEIVGGGRAGADFQIAF